MESLINLSFGNHELKLKFSKLGVILSINLLISDDPKSFREVIEKKYCPENQ
jgi:FtsH-binding integral membrane protein